MYVEPGQGNAAHTHEVEEVFFVLQGYLTAFIQDEAGRRLDVKLGPWNASPARPVVMSGTAIQIAAQNLKAEIARRIGREVPLAEVDLEALAPLCCEGVLHNHKHTYAHGAAAAHVAVDPKTGETRLVEGQFLTAALAPLGAVPRSLPLSPPKIWHLLQNVRN